jgi:hypothetical protein
LWAVVGWLTASGDRGQATAAAIVLVHYASAAWLLTRSPWGDFAYLGDARTAFFWGVIEVLNPALFDYSVESLAALDEYLEAMRTRYLDQDDQFRCVFRGGVRSTIQGRPDKPLQPTSGAGRTS